MRSIGIIGGGASGVLAAIQFLKNGPAAAVHVFNHGYEFGRGVAYSCSDRHLLNVPAGKMSAFPAEPHHFHEWLQDRWPGQYSAESFVSRRLYGTYLQDTLQALAKERPGAFHLHSDRIDRLARRDGRYFLAGEAGTEVDVDTIILALGNLPPANPSLVGDRFVSDPRYLFNLWHDGDRLQRIQGEGSVVILGSGLTAVDAILQLREQGHRGQIEVISRRGQWPLVHDLRYKASEPPELSGLNPLQAVRRLRKEIGSINRHGGNWRQLIDGLRPKTNTIWSAWSSRQRRQFMRHLRPYWDAHRHRMAPEVWALIERDVNGGGLRLVAGRARSIVPEEAGLRVVYRLRRQTIDREVNASFVINCTGSETLERSRCQPLIRTLLDEGMAEFDPLGLGLVTNSAGALLDPAGEPVAGLFAIGPVRRGSLWETTAIPEIREQAATLARICQGPSA